MTQCLLHPSDAKIPWFVDVSADPASAVSWPVKRMARICASATPQKTVLSTFPVTSASDINRPPAVHALKSIFQHIMPVSIFKRRRCSGAEHITHFEPKGQSVDEGSWHLLDEREDPIPARRENREVAIDPRASILFHLESGAARWESTILGVKTTGHACAPCQTHRGWPAWGTVMDGILFLLDKIKNFFSVLDFGV